MSFRSLIGRAAMIVAASLTHFSATQIRAADPPTAAPKVITVHLVNVTIPLDCRLRNLSSIEHPPLLYLQIYENGTLIGTSSTVVKGWEIDFPDVTENRWVIKQDEKTRYSIKVMDDNWFGDDLAFEISGCKWKDFLSGVIKERGPVAVATDQLATVEFELVPDPVSPPMPKSPKPGDSKPK